MKNLADRLVALGIIEIAKGLEPKMYSFVSDELGTLFFLNDEITSDPRVAMECMKRCIKVSLVLRGGCWSAGATTSAKKAWYDDLNYLTDKNAERAIIKACVEELEQ